jgi:uncharacterized protein (DUF433 family)
MDEILEDHPELEKENMLAILNFVKRYMSGRSTHEVA